MSDLPPLDAQQAYVVVGSNEQVGPYALELLISEVVAGRLADTTPVWWPPLADWTTMSMHPGVAAEIARRRATAGSAPAWAASGAPTPTSPYDPAPTPQPFAGPDPTETSHNDPAPAVSDPFGSDPFASDPFSSVHASADPSTGAFEDTSALPADEPEVETDADDTVFSATSGFESPSTSFEPDVVDTEVVGAGIVDAEVVDAEVVSPGIVNSDVLEAESVEATPTVPESAEAESEADPVAGAGLGDTAVVESVPSAVDSTGSDAYRAESGLLDDFTRATFNALVERSSVRADSLARVASVDELFVNEVIASATSLGFGIDDRTDVDRRHELRFGEQSGNLLVISLGQIQSDDPEQIRSTAVPVTISYRTDSGAPLTASAATAKVNHGDVVVNPDEWTGQTTSSVSLFLSVEDYLADDLSLSGDALGRDVAAVVKVVRARIA